MTRSVKYGLIVLVIAAGSSLFYKKVYIPKTTYETVTPKVGDMYTEVFGVGNIGANNIYAITAQTGGKILQILTDKGQWVKKGEMLVSIDPVDLPKQLEEAKISVKKATLELEASKEELQSLKAQKALALVTFRRYERLQKQAFASKAEYDRTKADLDVIDAQIKATNARIDAAKIEVDRAGKNVEALEEKFARFSIYAPVDGYVIDREAEVAQSVAPTQPILKIVDPKSVWVKTYIDERLSGTVKVEQKAKIVLRSQAYRNYEGVVKRIEPQTDAVTLEKEVDVAFKTLPKPFYINEQAEVNIVTSQLKQVLKVPANAIVYQKLTPGVWTSHDGKAHFMTVKVLARDNKSVAVSGIDAKTVILMADPKKKALKEGMSVHL
ncbi:efflux RND transporter periplasmic adaptor subunit [Sulfurovum sp. NBC37-1]|uniref:efflux RND transporter periplasmic adaptor subunit n=1 Tax=Sulfurovum sp. (strain NBC37-1) TaxID=387093 RepID=UPI000158793E|nr:efflux RND transporter periplasmic adaptor subunit [Sulfurovum sp. NBC37-1]BAF72353.1 efflux system, membrane fusion protein [Sulfurovum sp. NBC37-1]